VPDDARRREVFAMGRTIADALREKGRQEGYQEGRLKGKRDALIRVLRKKFGRVPAALLKRIEATERFDLLDAWLVLAVKARRLADVNFAE
jgi:hypothetical protein